MNKRDQRFMTMKLHMGVPGARFEARLIPVCGAERGPYHPVTTVTAEVDCSKCLEWIEHAKDDRYLNDNG